MDTTFRILLMENITEDVERIEKEILESGLPFDPFRVENPGKLARVLRETPPDIILSGHRPPELDALKLLELARKQAPGTPFIVVAGSLGEETAVRCMKEGAWDWIPKNRPRRIVPAISDALEKKRRINEKTRADEALESSRNFYLNLLENLPVLIWKTDPKGKFHYLNRKWGEFTGPSAEGTLNEKWSEDIHPEDVEKLFRDLRAAHMSATPFESEFRLLDQEGKYRRIQTFGTPYFNEEGIYSGHIGYGLDRTEIHETEEVLYKLSRAVEQNTGAILITDTEGSVEYANPSFSEMTGYCLEEIIGTNCRHNAAAPDIFGEAWKSLREKGSWHGERLSRKKNDDFYWEKATISPITNADDLTTHYLVELEDISKRKETERELSRSREELVRNHEELNSLFIQVAASQKEWESTMDCIGDMVILITSDGMIKRCNRAVREFTSLSYCEIMETPWRDFLRRHGLNLPEELSSGYEVLHEPSGRWFLCASYPYFTNKHKEVSGVVVTMHDFTRQKAVSDELERAYAELKSTQAKIVQQEKMASIGQLAAGVAHEINNPMSFISSNLGTMKKYLERLAEFVASASETIKSFPDENRGKAFQDHRKALKIDYTLEDGAELINESLEGAERVRSIVMNLKRFSHVDESECKPADINECLESTIKIAWNELKYKATLIRELEDIPPIRCFPQQLNQVFMNLLLNAVQAIEEQGEIRVRTWREDDSVYASVSDTGCGIPEEILTRVFEPFFTTKEVGKGTGLGLSITYDIIKKHKGEISVESRPGQGTTFTVRLPIS